MSRELHRYAEHVVLIDTQSSGPPKAALNLQSTFVKLTVTAFWGRGGGSEETV
jgi:hypothetical protein